MRKIISALLVVFMTISLCACNSDKKNPENESSQYFTDTYKSSSIKFKLNHQVILNNGEMTGKEEELTSEDIMYHLNEAMNALIHLDLNILKNYVSEDEFFIYKKIANNTEVKALWDRTIGNISYLPESNLFIGKFPSVLQSVWYNDMCEKNQKIKNPNELTMEEMVDIYNTYYEKTPVCISFCRGIDDYLIEDGEIHFNLTQIFSSIGVSYLEHLIPEDWSPETPQNGNIHQLLISWWPAQDNVSDCAAIKQNEEFLLYDSIMSKDLEKAVKIIDDNKDFFETKNNKDEYKKYLKNKDNRETLQTFINENIYVYRTYSEIILLCKVDTTKSFGIYGDLMSEREKEKIKNVEYYDIICIPSLTDNDLQWEKSFGEIIQIAKNNNVIK